MKLNFAAVTLNALFLNGMEDVSAPVEVTIAPAMPRFEPTLPRPPGPHINQDRR